MKSLKHNFPWVAALFFAGALALSGCAKTAPEPGEIFSCTDDSCINKTVAPEAFLESFSCVLQKWKGADTLHFNVAIKNISQTDQRFKVNIFLENGKAVGGLLPRKTAKGLVKPGQTIRFSYPVKGMDSRPGNIDLIIKTMDR